MVVNPDNPLTKVMITQAGRATSALGIKLVVLEARRVEDLSGAIQQARQRAQAAIVQPDLVSIHARQLIAAQTVKQRLPVIYGQSEFVDAGGLMSYGPSMAMLWRRVGDYADKILKGATPATMPIEQPGTFELVVNLKAAKGVGVSVPHSLLARANRVIQ
jgi:putative ABC transport system substrate-binding protein